MDVKIRSKIPNRKTAVCNIVSKYTVQALYRLDRDRNQGHD